jgi:RNA polymerase sigma factor (sigma-70 family)
MTTSAGQLLSHLRRLATSPVLLSASDGVLLARFAEHRDQVAFSTLVARHGPMVLNVCRRVLGNAHAAEDSFQAAFLVLARRAGSIRLGDSLAAWLYGVAYRVALKARRSSKRKSGCQSLAATAEVVDPHSDPLAELTARELLEVLEHEVQRLPESYRLPVVLCCLDGLSLKEAAERLGWSEGSVKGRLERGRARLHTRLARRGLMLSAALGVLEAARGSLWAGLPVGLADRMVKAGVAFATNQTASLVPVSAEVLHLAQSALKETVMLKLKLALVAALLVGVTTFGVGGVLLSPAVPNPDGPQPLVARPEQLQPKDGERRVDSHGDPLPPGVLARLGTVRFRHEGQAMQLLFAAGGKMLVGNTSSGVIVWDATTGTELHRSPGRIGHLGSGADLDVSPDGTTLAAVQFRGKKATEISLWDLQTGKKTRTLSLPPPKDPVLRERIGSTLRFAPDGKSLALTRAGEGTVQILDLATGKVRASFGDVRTGMTCLAFSPDGKTLALGVDNPGLQLWDIATGKMIHGLDNMAFAVAFSPKGNMVASGKGDRIMLFDPVSGKELGSLQARMAGVNGLSFTPDGKTLVCAGWDGKVRIWDIATKKTRWVLDSRMWPGRSMALSPDGKTVVIGAGGAVRLWNVLTGKELFTEYQGHDSWVNCLAFSPDGKTLVSGEFNHQIRLWDTAKWKPSRVFKGRAWSLSFSPDGRRLASAPRYNTVQVWDMDTGKHREIKVPEAEDVRLVMFSADGGKLITLDRGPDKTGNSPWGLHRLRHWNASTGKQEKMWTIPGHMYEPVLAPGGTAVLVGNPDSIRLHDARSGRDRLFRSSAASEMQTLAVSPDGRVLASGDLSRPFAVRLWEVATGKEIHVLKGHECAVTSVVWSPDGRLVASADNNKNYANPDKGVNSVRVWDAVTGKELARFGGLSTVVTSLAFSPDGSYLAGGLQDSTILVWDVRPSARPARLATKKLQAAELEGLWADLAGDAPKAHRAIWTLVAASKQSVPFLRARLKPVAVLANAGQVQQWIADLDSEKFAVRQAAKKELDKAGSQDQVKALILKALKGKVTLEARRRLEQVLNSLPDVLDSSRLRTVRAFMVLEQVASPQAQDVLKALAKGAPAERETEEAQAALDRLTRRPSRIP